MTIDVQLADVGQMADAGQKPRPLPRIPIPPAPKSAPPVPPQHFPQTLSPRPLPSPPDSGVTAYSVSPVSPLSPPTPAFESVRLSPPCGWTGPPRSSSLSLKVQTSPDALEPRDLETLETPISPELPSPRTVQRKRINKLRRHLGESVQVVLDRPDKVDVLAGLRHAGNEDDFPILNVTVESVLELQSSPDSDTSSECDGDEADDRVDYFFPPARGSRKWMRERGKARWTEDDFTKVLQDLRAL